MTEVALATNIALYLSGDSFTSSNSGVSGVSLYTTHDITLDIELVELPIVPLVILDINIELVILGMPGTLRFNPKP